MVDDQVSVLLIEDNPGDARLLQEMMADAKGVSVHIAWVRRLKEGLQTLQESDFDIVLLDLSLPDSEGFETFATLHTNAPHLPIVVLSGLNDETLAVKAVRQGAQDYLVKGQIDGPLLARAIQYAIERKRIQEETRRRAAHLEALNAIISTAAITLSVEELLQDTLDQTMQALNADAGTIWWLGYCIDKTLCLHDEGISSQEVLAAGLAINERIAVGDWEDLADDAPISRLAPYMTSLGVRSTLAIPMSTEGRRHGGLAVLSFESREWLEEEIDLMEAVGQHLGASIERLRLFQSEREQRELAEALQEAAASVSGTLEADKVLDRILEQVERVMPGDAVNILLVMDNAVAHLSRYRGYSQLADDVHFQIEDIPNLEKMAQTGEPVLVPNVNEDPKWISIENQDWVKSYLGAPIKAGDQLLGYLNVNSREVGQFTSNDAKQLQAFANHAAIAIQNARLYQQLLNYADDLERRVQERTAELEAQYARLEAILQSSSDGLIVTDAQGDVIQMNPIAETWLEERLSPRDAQTAHSAIAHLSQRADERPETVLELAGLDLQLTAAPVTVPVGEATAVVAVHDVSHLKALDRMKSRFITNISHELRTPITTVKLYTELMKRSPKEKWEQYLEALSQEAERQAKLVNEVLEISKLDTGQVQMTPRPTSVNELVEGVFTSLRDMARKKGVSFDQQLTSEETTARIDPQKTSQAITNLTLNAIQYTPSGGRVLLTTERRDTGKQAWITVAVQDTGVGIPPDEIPHIFERFFRGEQPRQMQVSGTGLGLAITKEIINLQGGHIEVKSEVDEGTTFTALFPTAEERDPTSPSNASTLRVGREE